MKTRFMKAVVMVYVVLLTVFLGVGNLYSDEIQMPFDDTGRIKVITPDMEKELEVFPEFQNFVEARLFQSEDETYVLEITFLNGELYIRKRIQMKEDEMKMLRKRITERAFEVEKSKKIDADPTKITMDAKVPFLISTTALGLYDGLSLYFILNGTNQVAPTPLIGSILLGLSGGFFVPFILTYDTPISGTQAGMYVYGSVMGIIHGLCFDYFLMGDAMFSNMQLTLGIPLLFSIGESLLGFYLADALQLTEAQNALFGIGSAYVTGMFLGTAALSGLIDNISNSGYIIPTAVFLGTLAGAVGGYYLPNLDDYSAGDIALITLSIGLGSYAGFAIDMVLNIGNTNTTDMDFGKGIIASLMLGSTFGLVSGLALVHGRDFDGDQATYTILGAGGGLLLASGLTLMFQPPSDMLSIYLLSSALGGYIGAGILYGLFSKESPAPKTAKREKDPLSIRFYPESLAIGLYLEKYPQKDIVGHMPILNFSYEF